MKGCHTNAVAALHTVNYYSLEFLFINKEIAPPIPSIPNITNVKKAINLSFVNETTSCSSLTIFKYALSSIKTKKEYIVKK